MTKLTDMLPVEVARELELKPFQGRQIFQWLYRNKVFDFGAMTNLSKGLRERLAEQCIAAQLRMLGSDSSRRSRGTRKVLFELCDGHVVEAVLIRDGARYTVCVSTQVGCSLGCPFCATGQSGFVRNLGPGEIAEQALHLLADLPEDEGGSPNIVYMGMGEPLLNYEATMRSIRLLMAKEGIGVGARRITVSTAGHVPGIRRFAGEQWQVRLSVSLHAANDELRSRLVPLNRRYPIRELVAALKQYRTETGRQITFEWVLLRDVNTSFEAADELVRLARPLKATVNLIPYNPVAEGRFEPPTRPQAVAFRDALNQKGVRATLRRERGADIDAACGQLRGKRGEAR